MKHTRVPVKITLDAYAASHRAVREMKEDGELPCRVKVRSSQYLNNLGEQDHRRVKQRIRPMDRDESLHLFIIARTLAFAPDPSSEQAIAVARKGGPRGRRLRA
jgi:transposase-like protein